MPALAENKRLGSRPEWASEVWDEAERAAWAPPRRTLTSEWAAQHRYLTPRQSPRCPGPWRDENQPVLRGIMDLCCRRTIRELWVKKCGQLGVSEAIRNDIGRRADQDPLALMLVLPNQIKGREIVRTRIIPLFEDTPRLRALLTGRKLDFKLTAISLVNGFDFRLAWAGSATALASDPLATVILDEVDKFQPSSGREAQPVDLARTRLRTLHRQKRSLLIALSTPTTDDGPVEIGYRDCAIKLWYFVPCPHCGRFQRLSFDRLRWQKFTELASASDRASMISTREAAWYECENPQCAIEHPEAGGRILEEQKLGMLLAGYWGTDTGSWKIFFDRHEEGAQPEGDKVGIQISALYDVATSWAQIAAEFVEADGRPDKLQHLYNSTLAETWKITVTPATSSTYETKCRPDPDRGFVPPREKLIPLWASRLLMTVDTQKDHFYFVIRAWGQRFRSQRIHHGKVTEFAELEELFYRAYFPYEGDKFEPLRCYKVGIDAGGGTEDERLEANRTQQVYEWCNLDPLWRLPLKGSSKPFEERCKWRHITYQPPHGKRDPFAVKLWLWDGEYYRDLLSSYVGTMLPVIDPATGELAAGPGVEQWALNDRCDSEYNQQMAAVIKSRRRKGRGYQEVYVTKTAGARHDYHDCEAEQIMMAHGPGDCIALLTPEQRAQQRQQSSNASRPGIRMPDGRPFLANQR
jgi:phage terminase large subunit GpA-like protein